MDTNRKKTVIDRVKKIETALDKYRLWGNMIPRGIWDNNLRKVLPKAEWDRIRKIVYKRQNFRCMICDSPEKLHCHEHWSYDYKSGSQQLKQLIGLCELCHMNQHLGFCQASLIPKGKLSWEKLADHWAKVNEKTSEEFYSHKDSAFELWRLRSKLKWKVVDLDGEEITSNYQKMKNF